MEKLTRQGVRDLDGRQENTRRDTKEEQQVCAHRWEEVQCSSDCWIYGRCSHAYDQCRICKVIK